MKKFLGVGAGLRAKHYNDVLGGGVRLDWFEALTENYLGMDGAAAGRPLQLLLKVREHFPIVLHGVSLSIGSTDPLNKKYLQRWRELIEVVEPEWVSDHLCWTGVHGNNLHDLFPLPYTEETVQHLVGRIQAVQEFLGRRILLENVSSYLEFKSSTMSEWDFVAEVARRSGCALLLDVNNIYVSSVNHTFKATNYIDAIPSEAVWQIHLAGPANHGTYLVDTHDSPVLAPVWRLYEYALQRFGAVSTMVEWDAKIPSFTRLEDEALKAKIILNRVIPANKIGVQARGRVEKNSREFL